MATLFHTICALVLLLALFAEPSLARPTARQLAGRRRPMPRLGGLFSPTDPDGSVRLAHAADQRTAWHKFGAGRLAGIPAWDLSNVRGKAYLTTVKDQGGCGSCVAHATLAALEASINYKTGSGSSTGLAPLPDLSEQQLYFCLGGRGCNDGWWINDAFQIAKNGITDEVCLPYRTDNTTFCTAFCPRTLKGGTVQIVMLRNWEEVRSHIVNHGPVVTGMTVFSDFPGFSDNPDMYGFSDSYIWPGTKTGRAEGGHAVMCYGFDDNMLNGVNATTRGVVMCKNSWGTSWGANGLFKAAYGADGLISGDDNVYGFIWTPAPTAPPPPPPPVVPTTARRTSTTTTKTSTRRTMTTTPVLPRNDGRAKSSTKGKARITTSARARNDRPVVVTTKRGRK